MTDRRALLTDREREIIADEADVSDSYRYQTISRVRARFDRLAADLDALEAHGELASELREIVCAGAAGASDSPADDRPGRDDDAEEAARSGEGDVEREPDGEADADLAGEVRAHLEAEALPPKTAHGRAAVVDVFRYLRANGTVETSEIQEAVYAEYTDEWGSARTMWNALDRYLEDVPGVEKGGYGEWAYAGDDAVRAALAE